MGVLDLTKYQGPFGTDQLSLWIFLARTKCLLAECLHSIKLYSLFLAYVFFRFMDSKSESCTLLTNYSWILNDIPNTKNQILSCRPTSVYFPSQAPHFGLWICCWTQESGSVGRSDTRHSSITVWCSVSLWLTFIYSPTWPAYPHWRGQEHLLLYPYFSFPFHFILLYAVFEKPESPVSFLEQEEK